MTVYMLTYGHPGDVKTRWIYEFNVLESGALSCVDHRGCGRLIGPSMAYSLVERPELPPSKREEAIEAGTIGMELQDASPVIGGTP